MAKSETFADLAKRNGLKPKLLYTTTEVCEVVGVYRQILYDEIEAGRLKGIIPGGRKRGYLFKPEWVDAWVNGDW